ncbi:hypothetical protein [Streptomyces sp. SID10815]|uniref:hypothetical protein n=1 Tax=Streptomyces sp. SID10815 TaxID=2706027 RepID=UPI0013C85EAD|nr:hypothetical protein [Streptomyces sp. SID10815]NEA50481.1 hypothetical protein [Streptomyces sp. SID10815]
MNDPMPADSIEYWDAATRTYYERQEDGAVISRPYNDEENAQADAKANRAVLVDQLLVACRAGTTDSEANDAFLADAGSSAESVLAQVAALTRQSNRHSEELAYLARLLLGRLESTSARFD